MKQLTIEDLKSMLGKDIWMFSPDYSFGGKRTLEKIDNEKIWVDHDSYLNIEDISVKMIIFDSKPDWVNIGI